MACDIDDLLPEVLIYAPKVPHIVAFRFIREIAKEFCQRTRLWRAQDEFEVTAPESEGITTISDANIFEVEWAELEDIALEPVKPSWLDQNVPLWQTLENETAKYVTQLSPNTLTVVPKATGTLKLRLVLEPSRKAMTLPDFMVEQHGTLIGRGAAARIMLTPDQDYTNPNLGAAMNAEFKADLDRLAVKAVKGQQRAPLRTKGSFF